MNRKEVNKLNISLSKENLKRCSKCTEIKGLGEFSKNKNQKDGYSHYCKACRKIETKTRKKQHDCSHYRRRYGITLEMYEEMLIQQNYQCAICGVDAKDAHLHKLFVDHCHATGRVRGLLCNQCNTGIGMLQDSKEILAKAMVYLDD